MRLWDKEQDPRSLAREGQEVWAEVPESNGCYLVSNLGRYFSVATGAVLRGSQGATGYILYPTGPKKSMTAHRLVLLTFDGAPPSEEHTDGRHLDGHKTNNAITNLKWGTRSENMLDVWDAKRRGVPSSSTDVSPVANPTYALPESSVEKGIRLFEKGAISLTDLATLWNVSTDVTRRVLVGETWPYMQRDLAAIEKHLGRTGEAHHKAQFTEEQLIEALQLYTDNHWSGVQFSNFLGIKQVSGHMILSGKRWAHVARPEGFLYPWPDSQTMNARTGSSHHAAKLDEATVAAVFEGVLNGKYTSVKEICAEIGLARGPVGAMLKGTSWSHVPRPSGLDDAVEQLLTRKTSFSQEQQEALHQALLEKRPVEETCKTFEISRSTYFKLRKEWTATMPDSAT